ncbi:MAG TPA: DegT/DnrJ/EryC1/StrS family aminotransferase [Egibacteraceae bacterium]
MTSIPLAVPQLTGNESRYVQECLDSGFVSSVGPFVERFEREFAAAVGARHAVACASGTAALHVALQLSGAAPGRVVAVSDFTFIASANAIRYTGAEPLLVDSEPATWNLDTARLHDEVVRRARRGLPLPAVIEVVHVLGHPADVEPLLDLRARFGIRLVEDAAEALGATYRAGPLAGRWVGTVGDVGCFSFNGNKIITTGGGGMIVTDDADTAARARHLTTQAKTPGVGYVHDEVGYNYRLTNVAAALGVAQLEQLPAFIAAKRRIAARYRQALEGVVASAVPAAPWAAPSHWLASVLLRDDAPPLTAVLQRLAAEGVQARPLWPPLHQQAPYRDAARLGGAVGDDLYARGLSLPSSVGLTDDEQDHVVAAVVAALER